MNDTHLNELIRTQRALTRALNNTNQILLKILEYGILTKTPKNSTVIEDFKKLKKTIVGDPDAPLLDTED